MDTIRNHLWIWGHPKNSLQNAFGIKAESNRTPLDGIAELGARNLFYVPMGRPTDRDAETEKMSAACLRCGWSIESTTQIDGFLARHEKCPNQNIAVFDDFFRPEYEGNNMTVHPAEELIALRRRLNDAGVELWVVWYERDMNIDISPYLDAFDGITFWFWSQPTAEEYDTISRKFVDLTPGKRRMLGCYLYDFGREKPCDPALVRRELDLGAEKIRKKEIEGIILHTNAVGGMGLEGYDAAIEWVKAHGDETV